jgi:hypothetical protein
MGRRLLLHVRTFFNRLRKSGQAFPFIVSRAWMLYRIEVLHPPPGHTATPYVLRDIIKETRCIYGQTRCHIPEDKSSLIPLWEPQTSHHCPQQRHQYHEATNNMMINTNSSQKYTKMGAVAKHDTIYFEHLRGPHPKTKYIHITTPDTPTSIKSSIVHTKTTPSQRQFPDHVGWPQFYVYILKCKISSLPYELIKLIHTAQTTILN